MTGVTVGALNPATQTGSLTMPDHEFASTHSELSMRKVPRIRRPPRAKSSRVATLRLNAYVSSLRTRDGSAGSLRVEEVGQNDIECVREFDERVDRRAPRASFELGNPLRRRADLPRQIPLRQVLRSSELGDPFSELLHDAFGVVAHARTVSADAPDR